MVFLRDIIADFCEALPDMLVELWERMRGRNREKGPGPSRSEARASDRNTSPHRLSRTTRGLASRKRGRMN